MQEYVRYKAQFNKLIQEQIELLNGSRFDIQTDDLLAFQKMNEESVKEQDNDLADTKPLPGEETSATTEGNSDASAAKVSFGAVEETDTNYESAIPETASSVEVFPGYKVTDEMNNLDYLNAAERMNEEAFLNSTEQ